MTAEDLTTIIKRKEKGVPYDQEPLVQVFLQLITDRPGGGFWSYAELKEAGAKILGFPLSPICETSATSWTAGWPASCSNGMV